MYVGPWQEYKLGQLFSEQTRALADAVRHQIQLQIQEEQTKQPQVQLPHQHRAPPASSHSGSLRRAQFHANSNGAAPSTASSAASRFSSNLTPSSAASSVSSSHQQQQHWPTSGAHSASVSQLHTPKSSHSVASTRSLPSLQAAARAAVQQMQASRLRATASHPLAHLVSTYYPEALSEISSPALSNRPSSRLSHTSSASMPNMDDRYLGYRPPRLRTKKKDPRNISHKDHIARMRTLYGLQNATTQPQLEETKVDEEQPTSSQATSNADSRTDSRAASPSPNGVALPHVRAASPNAQSHSQTYSHHAAHSSPAHHPSSANGAPSTPHSPLPRLSKATVAMYGQLPSDVQDSLHFYANGGNFYHSNSNGPPAPLPLYSDTPTPTPPNLPPARADLGLNFARLKNVPDNQPPAWLADLRDHPSNVASPRGSLTNRRQLAIDLRQYGSNQYDQQVIADASPNSGSHQNATSNNAGRHTPTYGGRSNSSLRPSSRAADQARPRSTNGTQLAPLVSPLHGPQSSQPPPHPLTASASQAGLLAAAARAQAQSGAKMSTEARFMAGLDSASSSRLHTPLHPGLSGGSGGGPTSMRLHTPSLQQRLHSSGGYSESGEFEREVNDLLGWAGTLDADAESLSPHQSARSRSIQAMRVHE